MNICRLTDKAQIKAFLNADRIYHAYALADLAEPFYNQCRWLAAENDGNIESLVLLFKGLQPPALLTMGRAEYLPRIFANANLPDSAMFLSQESHLAPLLMRYRPQYIDPMLRMALPAGNFRPLPGGNVVRLTQHHLDELQQMYHNAHGNAFAAYQLRQGVFYGRFDGNELAAAAGTHLVAPEFGVAAVGNIYTRPHYRGLGYAQQVTSAVCRDLLAQNLDVVLNVEQNNAPAIHVYKKLGFIEHCLFWEGMGELRA